MKFLNKVLKEIKPSRQEEFFVKKEINKFLKSFSKNLKGAKPIVGGSFAKNTWLRGNYDIDIFVKFNYKRYCNKNISKELEKSLRKLKKTKLHGSRDYFIIKQGKISFEIVPVLYVKDYKQALNVTDVSPLHFRWVKKNSNKKLQDEIRLFKQFLKANNLYGAESYIKGFSGYVSEVLIIHYRGFNNLVKKASVWPDKVIIDVKKHYKNNEEVLRKLNWSKTYSPLVIIDPVQRNRNIAAALSAEKFEEFKTLCKSYLKDPNEDFFVKKEFDLDKLKDYLVLEVSPKPAKKDVAGAKLLKLFEFIKFRIEEEGFKLVNSDWHFNKKSYFWFKVQNETLELTKEHYGPLIKDKKNLEKFKKKWINYKLYKEGKKSYILLERKYFRFEDFLKNYIKDKEIKSRVRKISVKSIS